MVMNHVSRRLAVALVLLQVLGPAASWALEQPGVEAGRATGAVVAALSGGELTARSPQMTKTVQFNDAVAFGDTLQTTRDTTAEVLIDKQALVTILNESEVSLENVAGNTVVHVHNGTVLVSAAARALGENESVIVETPATQMMMRGGMLKATVGIAPRQADLMESPGASHTHLVSLATTRPFARAIGGNERVEVYEGSVQLTSRTAGATPLTIGPGQSVQTIDGRLGTPNAIESPAAETQPLLLAASQHAGTPVSGVELVSQRQMEQVGALQQALFGDPDAEIEGKEKEHGVIIATLFGTNPNQQGSSSNPNNPISSLFGSGSPYSAALLAAINRSGAGIVNDGSQSGGTLIATSDSFNNSVPYPINVKGGLGLLTISDRPSSTGTDRIRSVFGGTELMKVDGGVLADAPHNGRAPISTLVGQGLTDPVAFAIPRISPANPLAEATTDLIGTRLTARLFSNTVLDRTRLTFDPHEISVTSLLPQISPDLQVNQVNVELEVRNLKTLQPPVPVQITINRDFDFNVEGTKLTKVRIDSTDPTIDGILPTIDGILPIIVLRSPTGPLTAGQKFLISEVSTEPTGHLDGNRGLRFTSGSLAVSSVPDPNIVIVKGPLDGRAVVGESVDAESSSSVPTTEFVLSDFSSRTDGKACSFCRVGPTGTAANERPMPFDERVSYVDGVISARSSSDSSLPIFVASQSNNDRTVELSGGAVLTAGASFEVRNRAVRRDTTYQTDALGGIVGPNGNKPAPAEPSASSIYFTNKGLLPDITGSVAAIVANENNPAFVRIHDRLLAVLDGSSITPDLVNGQELRTSLLSVLDSQLIGPTKTPTSIVDGQEQPHRENNEVPPLIEIVDSSVRSTSAVVVRATEQGIGRFTLDHALLEASAPILVVSSSPGSSNGIMTATGHLIDLAGRGPNGKNLLNASLVPGDALVRLDRGTLNVNGNLLNLANGASATVNGYLFSLANGSTLNVNGTLLNLTGNSVFHLQNTNAFGIFGEGTNKLVVGNNLCAGGNCGSLTDQNGSQFRLSNGQPIQVFGVGRNDVKLPAGFTPFSKSANANPDLQIGEHTALLHVEPGSELHINNVPVIRR